MSIVTGFLGTPLHNAQKGGVQGYKYIDIKI